MFGPMTRDRDPLTEQQDFLPFYLSLLWSLSRVTTWLRALQGGQDARHLTPSRQQSPLPPESPIPSWGPMFHLAGRHASGQQQEAWTHPSELGPTLL